MSWKRSRNAVVSNLTHVSSRREYEDDGLLFREERLEVMQERGEMLSRLGFSDGFALHITCGRRYKVKKEVTDTIQLKYRWSDSSLVGSFIKMTKGPTRRMRDVLGWRYQTSGTDMQMFGTL